MLSAGLFLGVGLGFTILEVGDGLSLFLTGTYAIFHFADWLFFLGRVHGEHFSESGLAFPGRLNLIAS